MFHLWNKLPNKCFLFQKYLKTMRKLMKRNQKHKLKLKPNSINPSNKVSYPPPTKVKSITAKDNRSHKCSSTNSIDDQYAIFIFHHFINICQLNTMQFSSQSVKNTLQKTQTPTLHSLKQYSKNKYKQTLSFMQ